MREAAKLFGALAGTSAILAVAVYTVLAPYLGGA